jgi:hypothetical protein
VALSFRSMRRSVTMTFSRAHQATRDAVQELASSGWPLRKAQDAHQGVESLRPV